MLDNTINSSTFKVVDFLSTMTKTQYYYISVGGQTLSHRSNCVNFEIKSNSLHFIVIGIQTTGYVCTILCFSFIKNPRF